MGSREDVHCGTDPREVSGSVYFTGRCPGSVTIGFLVVGSILSTAKPAGKITAPSPNYPNRLAATHLARR